MSLDPGGMVVIQYLCLLAVASFDAPQISGLSRVGSLWCELVSILGLLFSNCWMTLTTLRRPVPFLVGVVALRNLCSGSLHG